MHNIMCSYMINAKFMASQLLKVYMNAPLMSLYPQLFLGSCGWKLLYRGKKNPPFSLGLYCHFSGCKYMHTVSFPDIPLESFSNSGGLSSVAAT